MNEFVVLMGRKLPPDVLATVTTPLLHTGAEFAKFEGIQNSYDLMACTLIRLASPLGFIEGKLRPARYLTFPCTDPLS